MRVVDQVASPVSSSRFPPTVIDPAPTAMVRVAVAFGPLMFTSPVTVSELVPAANVRIGVTASEVAPSVTEFATAAVVAGIVTVTDASMLTLSVEAGTRPQSQLPTFVQLLLVPCQLQVPLVTLKGLLVASARPALVA